MALSTLATSEIARRIWDISEECAQTVYDTRSPNDAYVRRTTQLLFGTAAQESGLVWERQRSMRFWSDRGAVSKWQLERGSIEDSIRWLRKRPESLQRATEFLFCDPHATTEWIDLVPLEFILWALRLDDNDRIGCLFARLHYFRDPRPIPETIEGQAVYYKNVFNTSAGKATPEQYLERWREYARMLE